jgi:hypothetical protein
LSVADEVEALAGAYAASARGTAAAGQGAKKAYGKAQELGMRFQNWRHQGAGESPDTPATTGSTKPAGKSWSTDEETYDQTTFYSHTSYRKKPS